MFSLNFCVVVYELNRFSRSVLMLTTSDCFCTIFDFRVIFLCFTFELLLVDDFECKGPELNERKNGRKTENQDKST